MSRRKILGLGLSVILLVAVVVGLNLRQQTGVPNPKTGLVGQPAPDFTLPLVGGGEVTLSELRGKVVLLNFWATWCPPCLAEMPSMERLYARLGNSDFEMLAVNAEVDGLEILPDFLLQHRHTFPIPVDHQGEVQVEYGVFRFPESFIIDRQGKIVDHIIGGRDWSDRRTVEHLAALIKG